VSPVAGETGRDARLLPLSLLLPDPLSEVVPRGAAAPPVLGAASSLRGESPVLVVLLVAALTV